MAKTKKSADIIRNLICDLRFEANRLEAALKREKDEIEADALAAGGIVEAERHKPGNMAAMREALVKIRRELNGYCNDSTLLDRMTEDPPDYTCLRDSLLEIERIVDSALSAPPRNCDRLPNSAAAIEAYREETGLNKHPAALWTAAQIYAFIGWLFAKVAERKGEADGSK